MFVYVLFRFCLCISDWKLPSPSGLSNCGKKKNEVLWKKKKSESLAAVVGMKELAKKIPTQIIFFPATDLCPSSRPFSSLNRIFISSKQGNGGMYWVCRCLSLHISARQLSQLSRNSSSELQTGYGADAVLSVLGQLWKLFGGPGHSAFESRKWAYITLCFPFCSELPAKPPWVGVEKGLKCLGSSSDVRSAILWAISSTYLTGAVVARFQYDWVQAGCSQVWCRPSYFFNHALKIHWHHS